MSHTVGLLLLISPNLLRCGSFLQSRSIFASVQSHLIESSSVFAMSLWQLYFHLVWATKNREALITEADEECLYQYLRSKANRLDCITHAIGGTEDHIHLIISIPPKLSIAQVVKQLKGSSSHELNQRRSSSEDKFGWQNEYGVFSLGRKQLDRAIEYVERQKEHHAAGSVIGMFEQTSGGL